MARKPNYDFERKERERIKAQKKAKRAAEKKDAQERKSEEPVTVSDSDTPSPVSPTSE